MVAALVAGGGVALTSAAVVAAESPNAVAQELAIDGAFVAPERTDVDEAKLVEQANQARAKGLKLMVVVPNDPRPTPKAYARRILEATEADVALVFPSEGGLEAATDPEFDSEGFRALAAARSKADPVLATQVYVEQILTPPERSLPAVVARYALVVLILAAILAGVVILEQIVRRGRAPTAPLPKPAWWSRIR